LGGSAPGCASPGVFSNQMEGVDGALGHAKPRESFKDLTK